MKYSLILIILAYSITSFGQSNDAYSAHDGRSSAKFGVLAMQQFNLHTFHSSLYFNFKKGIFGAYLGPSYSVLGASFVTKDPVDSYRRNNLGITAGIRFGSAKENKAVTPFFQLKFNFINTEISESQLGPSSQTSRNSWISEGNIGLGLNFSPSSDLKFFIGGGVGSSVRSNGLSPHSFLGLSVYF